MRTRVLLCLSLMWLPLLAGCGSGGSSSIPSNSPSLSSLAITSASGSIVVGQNEQLTATAKYSDGSTQNVTSSVKWSSSSAAVATVSNSGVVTALAVGQVKIAATLDSISGSMSVSVTHRLVSLSVTSTSNAYTTAVGTSLQFNAFAHYNDGTSSNVTSSAVWKSTAAAIAGISNSGLLTPLAAGSAEVEATYNGMTGSANVSVTDTLLSLSISPNANAVNVGSSLQLTAMGTYQDGKPARAVSGVTWTSSASNLASVSNGLVAGVKGGSVKITATLGSLSASLQLSINPVLQSITVSPAGPALVVGGQQQFRAQGSYNDGSVQDLTNTVQWSSSDSSKASAAPGGVVTAVSTGLLTINATSAGVTGSTAMNIVSSFYTNFTGPYAFTLTSSSGQGAAFFVGSITADAQGNITGVEDANTSSGVQQSVAVTGYSFIYPDGRGVLVFNRNACHPNGITLRFLLTSGGNKGSLIQFDGQGSAKGTLEMQSPSAFNAAALNGTYVFRASGVDSSVQPFGVVGEFAADGAGNVSSGTEDLNDAGNVSLQVALSASTYSVNANGRGTLQLASASGSSNYAAYVIDSTKLYLIETDAMPANAVVGSAELQTAQLYDASSLNGYYGFQLDQPLQVNAGALNYFNFEQLGRFDLDGAGNMGGVRDGESMAGLYNVSNNGVNGRGMLSTQGTLPGQSNTDFRLYLFYVVSPSKVYMLQCYSLPTASALTPAIGEAVLQTGTPYSTATLTGIYGVSAFDMTAQTESLMWLSMSGGGSIQGIADVGGFGTAVSTVIGNPQFLSAPDSTGFTSMQLTTSAGTQQYAFYMVSGAKAYLGTLNPPTYGSLDEQ